MNPFRSSQARFFLVLGFVYLSVLIWSGIHPHDRYTWYLEIAPSLIALPILIATYKKFPFTRWVYVFFVLHSCILFIGGKYTYAKNPLFEWIKIHTGGDRNQYDKLGHFAQGFFPAFFLRELYLGKKIFANLKWIPFFVITTIALVTVSYEFIEWWAVVLLGGSANAFLGTQGYVWDTQSDMLLALIGAICACFCFRWIYQKRTG